MDTAMKVICKFCMTNIILFEMKNFINVDGWMDVC